MPHYFAIYLLINTDTLVGPIKTDTLKFEQYNSKSFKHYS